MPDGSEIDYHVRLINYLQRNKIRLVHLSVTTGVFYFCMSRQKLGSARTALLWILCLRTLVQCVKWAGQGREKCHQANGCVLGSSEVAPSSILPVSSIARSVIEAGKISVSLDSNLRPVDWCTQPRIWYPSRWFSPTWNLNLPQYMAVAVGTWTCFYMHTYAGL